MSIKQYLLPQNSGAQIWQMAASNLTPGWHARNFSGLCMAIVTQWLLELRFAAGASPEELGRYLLQGWLGKHGYAGIANSQQIYDGPESESGMVLRHSGGTLQRHPCATGIATAANHYAVIAGQVHGGAVYNGLIGLEGTNSWLMSWVMGTDWGHAIGMHFDGLRYHVFDPNYGVFIVDAAAMQQFMLDLWQEYGASNGDFAEIANN